MIKYVPITLDYAFVLLFAMLFCHIVDDYYLQLQGQGWLAYAKQKKWWEENFPDELYKYDYIMALAEHAFSWSFMIHLPIVITFIILGTPLHRVFISYFVNWLIHMLVDNLKANWLKINLIQDQTIHFIQIIVTWWLVVMKLY